MFWDVFIALCVKNNKKPNPVAKELGFGSSAVTYWKKGTIPNDISLKKIADYFGVTVDYLLGKEQAPTPRPSENTLTLYGRDGSKTDRTLTEEQYKLILGLLGQMPDEK